MLKWIRYTNLRLDDQEFDLPQHIEVSGKNGAGKSSLKEAISFLLAGTDSAGTRNPKHLLRDPEKPLLVRGVTRKGATIERRLDPKGSQKIELIRPGSELSEQLTQQEFAGLIGANTEVVLSVINPGYFLTRSFPHQAQVLSELVPPRPRRELIEQVFAGKLPDWVSSLLDSPKSNLAVTTEVTEARRNADKDIARLDGAIATLKTQTERLQMAPRAPTAGYSQARLLELEELKEKWIHFRTAKQIHDVDARKKAEAEKELDELRREYKEVQDKKTALGEFESAEGEETAYKNLFTTWQELRRPEPPQPLAEKSIVEEENCPTCGQTVGIRHREAMRVKNQEIRAEFDRALAEWTKGPFAEYEAKKETLREGVEASKILVEEARKKERLVREWDDRLAKILTKSAELKAIAERPLPPLPEEPKENFDEASYREEMKKAEEAARAQGAADRIDIELKKLAESIAQAEKNRADARDNLEILQAIEAVIKRLPDLQMKDIREALSLPKPYLVTFTDKSIDLVDERGTPFALFSDGEKLRASTLISLRLNSLLKRPLNILFLDNADLCDWVSELMDHDTVQTFTAVVRPGEPLEITERVPSDPC